ncbi:cytokine-like protein 1 isoform X2 [Rhincodon typus]|uniref:cytokine-like protein 1 isoform X2 n=1 Tax=Rhincodon typus TaxID=259920 RepID=UPI0009A30473|nr:cytokine-like protein 1 isoform X2 [Rhincodon typus]
MLLSLDLVLFLSAAMVTNAAPLTCYSRMLGMRKEINSSIENLQAKQFTKRCVAKLPDLHIDIHNFCVMSKLRTYLQAMEKVTDRRCQNVLQPTVQLIRHLYLIMVVPCKAELVFLTDDCSVLRRKASTTT